MSERGVFERHPGRTRAALLLIFGSVSILLAEFVLRTLEYAPGRTFYQKVDELVVDQRFFTDEHGIFKASPDVPIVHWGKRVVINREGFRGAEFTPPRPGQESILLLGDSFAYGATAVPLDNSFADLLAGHGYRVFNTGIPAVGVRQYEALAKFYVPRLRPDHVIVSFYMENDLRKKPDCMTPSWNLYHDTNAGWLRGCDDDGRPLTAEESYAYYIDNEVLLKRFAYKTALGTITWNAVRAVTSGELPYRMTALLRSRDLVAEYAQTFDRLRSIRSVALANGARFHLVVIPSRGPNCSHHEKRVDLYREVFDTLEPIYLDDLPEQTYFPAPDCHFNNEGHRFVADRIAGAIR